MDTLGDRLKTIRKQQKLNQTDFGGLLGTSLKAYSNYETNRVVPDATFIKLLCSKFSISEKWLRTGEGEMYDDPQETYIRDIAAAYSMTEKQIATIRGFLRLTSEQREAIANIICRWAEEIESAAPDTEERHSESEDERIEREVDEETEIFRAERLKEKRAEAGLSVSLSPTGTSTDESHRHIANK